MERRYQHDETRYHPEHHFHSYIRIIRFFRSSRARLLRPVSRSGHGQQVQEDTMIKCSKCGTPVVQYGDELLHRGCNCYGPLIMTPVITGSLFVTSGSTTAYQPISDTPIKPAAEQPDSLKLEHVERMAAFLAEHERNCERCSYFFYRGESTRCPEYWNSEKVLEKWQKRIGVQHE